MAPVRRYLRITKYSVLECRIYLENPALVQSWLLNPREPMLPSVIESVRPWVLPKLREERDRARKKSSNKKKGIKDTVVEGIFSRQSTEQSTLLTLSDDFEVSIFLTETSTRHSILTKHKHFHDKSQTRLTSNTNKMLGADKENPVDLDVPVLREQDSDEDVQISDIPVAPSDNNSKRPRNRPDDEFGASEDETTSAVEVDSDAEEPPQKRLREDNADDKKKMDMDVSYEGFAIYGRVLCLVVRKRDNPRKRAPGKAASGLQPAGQAKMENWITSTQIPVGEEVP